MSTITTKWLAQQFKQTLEASDEEYLIDQCKVHHRRIIIPIKAPFYRASVKVIHNRTQMALQEGLDWGCLLPFDGFFKIDANPVYGAIEIFSHVPEGSVRIHYQGIGEVFVNHPSSLYETLSRYLNEKPTLSWEEVAQVPDQFPSKEHQHTLTDVVGFEDVVTAIQELTQTIERISLQKKRLQQHVDNRNNPHGVSKAQVGLSELENFPIATRAQAIDGVCDEAYMTPRRVRQANEVYTQRAMDQHIEDHQNPHGVNKGQIGLDQVENFPVSDTKTAIEGLSQTHYMTPYLVFRTIEHYALKRLQTHARADNPHKITKQTIGLEEVCNLPLASDQEAILGTRDTGYMTPRLTALLFQHRIKVMEARIQHLEETLSSQ